MASYSEMLLDTKIEMLLSQKKAVDVSIRDLEKKIADWFSGNQRDRLVILKKKTFDVLVREDGLSLLNSLCGWKTATSIQKKAAIGYINVSLVMQEESEIIRLYLSDYATKLNDRNDIILALRELGVELPVMYIPLCDGDNTTSTSCVPPFHCENSDVLSSVE
jgi:hypothetical protein